MRVTTTLNQLWYSIADAGRDLVRGRRARGVESLCRDLMSSRGDASGAALARDLVETLRSGRPEIRLAFFRLVAGRYGVDRERLLAAANAYGHEPSHDHLIALRRATEAPRQELFRRMNLAPGGTWALVRLREELLGLIAEHPEFGEVDGDMRALLTGWFNPGFLSLARIDWNSPAALLEKLVRYEKVHRMAGLDALKRRLAADRRCFAFFHPALPDEPLIFVQVALVDGLAEAIPPLLDAAAPVSDPTEAESAIFYSISNCQEGLRGITLGNFLIKAVVADLAAQLPEIRMFATLSPVPGFAAWLRAELEGGRTWPVTDADRRDLGPVSDAAWALDPERAEGLRPLLLRLCAHYLVREKVRDRPMDPVARFHLGNGARLERLNWLADPSPDGLRQSHGLLVNYRYDPGSIERNHEQYVSNGDVICASAIRALLPAPPRAVAADAPPRESKVTS